MTYSHLAEGAPVELTADNFQNHISSHDQTLVEFFAPWCGHCKALKPEYEEAARRLHPNHKIATVDCTVHSDLCAQYQVRGYPTLKLIRKDGSVSEYEDARKADAIVKYVIKQASPAFIVAKTQDEVDAFKKAAGSDLKVVLYTTSEDSDAATAFKKTASALRNDVDFAISTGATGDKVTLYRTFDTPEVTFEGPITTDAVNAWIKNESLPLVGEIGPENYHKYVERDLPLLWAFLDFSNAEQNDLPAKLAPVAAKHRSSVILVKIDGQRWGDHAKTFGLTGSLPGLVIEDRKVRKNYVFPENTPVTAEAVDQHIADFIAGKLTATVRSEEIPEKNDGPVKIVVGKTWDSIVMDDSKDVFIEFYAPWCGHCKSLAPKYEQLGKVFSGEQDKVVIAKIDGVENDTPVDIQGFPTMFLYPANDKKNPIAYNGKLISINIIYYLLLYSISCTLE